MILFCTFNYYCYIDINWNNIDYYNRKSLSSNLAIISVISLNINGKSLLNYLVSAYSQA